MDKHKDLAREAEHCRRLARDYPGQMERSFLLSAAGEFERLSTAPEMRSRP